jgi:hypothetical protein
MRPNAAVTSTKKANTKLRLFILFPPESSS